AIGRHDRLRTSGRFDDRQPFVVKDGAGVGVDAAPSGAAVALSPRQRKRVAAKSGQVVARSEGEDAEDRTHMQFPLRWLEVVGDRLFRAATKKPALSSAGLGER